MFKSVLLSAFRRSPRRQSLSRARFTPELLERRVQLSAIAISVDAAASNIDVSDAGEHSYPADSNAVYDLLEQSADNAGNDARPRVLLEESQPLDAFLETTASNELSSVDVSGRVLRVEPPATRTTLSATAYTPTFLELQEFRTEFLAADIFPGTTEPSEEIGSTDQYAEPEATLDATPSTILNEQQPPERHSEVTPGDTLATPAVGQSGERKTPEASLSEIDTPLSPRQVMLDELPHREIDAFFATRPELDVENRTSAIAVSVLVVGRAFNGRRRRSRWDGRSD